MFDSEHADGDPSTIPDEKRLPPTATRTDEALRQDHKCDRLMVGHERQLVVAHPHIERLTPVARIDHLEHHIGQGASQAQQ